jgi:hypothetical protein
MQNIIDLSERLMQHPYFQESPGKDMLRLDVSRILNSHVRRQGPYKVERAELARAIDIILRNAEWYPDPISILRDFQKTFSFGSCTLSDPSYKEYAQEKQRKARGEETPAERFERIGQFWAKKYDTERAYRDLSDNYRRVNPDRYVFQNPDGLMEYFDGHVPAAQDMGNHPR